MTGKYECGIFCFHPRCLRKYSTVGSFVFWFGLSCTVSQAVHTYLITQLPTLERQFGFSSSQTGLIIACNDIGYLAFSVFMGYLATKVHIPKFLSACTFAVAVASVICAAPYFVSKDFLHGDAESKMDSLPSLEMIQMMQDMERVYYEGALGQDGADPGMGMFDIPNEPSSSFSPNTTFSSKSVTPTTQRYSSRSSVTKDPDSRLWSASSSMSTSRTTPVTTPLSTTVPTTTTRKPFDPFQTMSDTLRGYVGDEDFQKILDEVGIKKGDTPKMSMMGKFAKVIVNNPAYFNKLPPDYQFRAKMLARLSKRSAPNQQEEEPLPVTDVVSLSPFELMTIMMPKCTHWPKGPHNCEMFAKFLNKGFTHQYTSMAFVLLAIGMVIQGIAKSPRLPMAILYFDDNGSKAKTPMYLALTMTAFSIGVVLAFGVGIGCMRVYVTLKEVDVHPLNFHWVGAWWLGYIILAVISLVVAVPLLCFPKKLRVMAPVNKSTESTETKETNAGMKNIKEFFQAAKRCFSNPVLMGLFVTGTLTMMMMSGFMPFAPKYLETQFSLPIWKAMIFVGAVWLLPVLFGLPAIGVLVTKLKFSTFGILKLNLVFRVIVLVLAFLGMFMGCNTVKMIGYNDNMILSQEGSQDVSSDTCISECNCETVDYFPICGSNGRNYFSACHAGCSRVDDMVFQDCPCIGVNGTATMGLCGDDCHTLVPYLIIMALLGITLAGSGLTNAIVALRCVPQSDRSFTIGLMMFLTNLLGWMPGPIIFGRLTDSVCMLGRTMCAEVIGGACAVYDIESFRFVLHGFFLALSGAMVAITIFVLFKARHKKDWNDISPFEAKVNEVNGDVGERLMNSSI